MKPAELGLKEDLVNEKSQFFIQSAEYLPFFFSPGPA